jgi:phage/plasmid-associated DNA primase
VLTALLGEGSVSNVSLKSLADNRFAPIRTVGKLANICGDIDATYIERTGLLKQLAGEDPIDAEHKFRDSTQFTCWAVPVFSANEIPTSSDTSYGWQQRWEVFTFPHRFQYAPGLEAALRAPGELEGIAARGVAELRELMSRTPPEFTRTQAGDTAKAEFATHQDPLAVWLAEGCWAGDGWTDRRHAHAHYKYWCEDAGHRNTLGRTKFYGLMRERFPETLRDGWAGYAGLVLRHQEDDRSGRGSERICEDLPCSAACKWKQWKVPPIYLVRVCTGSKVGRVITVSTEHPLTWENADSGSHSAFPLPCAAGSERRQDCIGWQAHPRPRTTHQRLGNAWRTSAAWPWCCRCARV